MSGGATAGSGKVGGRIGRANYLPVRRSPRSLGSYLGQGIIIFLLSLRTHYFLQPGSLYHLSPALSFLLYPPPAPPIHDSPHVCPKVEDHWLLSGVVATMEKYDKIRTLGQGAFGVASLVRRRVVRASPPWIVARRGGDALPSCFFPSFQVSHLFCISNSAPLHPSGQ